MSERVLMNRAKKRSSIAEKTEERSQLAGEIKDLIKKGDQAANEAERHYRAAGQRLIELKASFPSWTDRTGWENYLRPKSVLASAAPPS
jgi:hypothetical protein